MKQIFYFGHCWADNVGNAFIDYGINYSLKEALKEYDVQVNNVSNVQPYNNYKFNQKFPYNLLSGGRKKKEDIFDLRMHTKPDLVVLGGSLFDVFWCKVHDLFLNWLIEKQYPVLVLGGGGGNDYSLEELAFVSAYWKKINFIGYIARDEKAFANFGKYAKIAYSGIDNAFFLNNAFNTVKLDIEPYVINTFDLTYPRVVKDGSKKIIKISHRLLDIDSFRLFLKRRFKAFKTVSTYDYVSDYPDDYLNLYANSYVTHSDRVHACVATLIFGGKTQYYDKSDRSYLFDRVNLSEIRNKPVSLDMDFIEKEKQSQLEAIRKIFNQIC
ncbi:polysaccharide pyruvyl transferase family protein [Hyunsoonleella aestuarii]|uniref:Polysaccharide pyruvyl transferase domain-containing protein n=1 Tax=Hyunsoonleella aestuarii TaxID=912802 RepID=A0ABP8E9F6_9FLAO|nr:polysaccharide pyruvyl transferase family protein [Hyunsoonleella aestuarii]